MILPDYVKKIAVPTPYPVGDVAFYYFKNANTTIDVGIYSKEYDDILNKNGISIGDLKVLATHGHSDHIGTAKFKKVKNLFLHPNDTEWLSYKYPGRETAERNLLKIGMPARYMDNMLNLLETIFRGFLLPDYEPLYDGEFFDIGNEKLIAIETPGHTPGSVSFFLKDEGIVFSGDTVLSNITSNPGTVFIAGMPFAEFATNSMQSYLTSLDKLEALNPVLIAGSHGINVENPKERIRQMRASYLNRIDQTYKLLKNSPMTVYEIARLIFSNHKASDQLILQLCEAISYVVYLSDMKLIVSDGKLWIAK